MKSRSTLRQSLISSYSLVSLIPLLLMALFILLFIVREKNVDFTARIDLLSQGVRGQIQLFMNQPLATLNTIAAMLADSEVNDSHKIERILNLNVRSSPYFERIYLIDPSGRVVDVGLRQNRENDRQDLLGIDLFHLPEFQRISASGELLWSDTFLSLASGELSVMLYIPAGENVLAAEIGLTKLAQFIEKLSSATVQTMIIDRNGAILFHPDAGQRGKGLMANDIELVAAALQGSEGTGLFRCQGETFFGATSIIEPIGWVALIAQPVDSFIATLTIPLLIICSGIGVAMILSLLLAINRSRKLANPLIEMTRQSDVIARGDYRHLLPPGEYQELTQLAVSINDMATAIQQREEALRDNELKYRELVENTNNLVLCLDQELRISYANHSLARLSGIDEGQAIGTHFSDCILAADWPEVETTLRAWCSCQDASGSLECRSQDGNGETHYLLLAFNLHYARGTLSDISIIGHDVTIRHQIENQRKELEEKQQRSQKMELLGLMAGGVAHDLNNILAGIINLPEIMLLTLDKNDELHHSLQSIKQSGERAAAVVADLLTIARGSVAAREPLALNQLIEDYLATPEFKRLCELHPDVAFRFSPADQLRSCVCSRTHIEKALMNLVINAFEAIHGEGLVEVATASLSADEIAVLTAELTPGDYVSIVVRDSGSGISAEDLQRIFEPFFSKKGLGRSGTGIGLSVVWNSIREHGGTVLVDSSPAGTQFRILLPVSGAAAELPAQPDEGQDLQGQGERVLVVDDEDILREIAVNMLRILGYRATAVNCGEKALEYLEQNEVELVILDMQMDPGMNGQQTYSLIHQRNPRQKALIATGFSSSEAVGRTIEEGAAGFIQKPYSLQGFGRAVRAALQQDDQSASS